MNRERDFSRVAFKVNCSGSWANLVYCDGKHIDEVKKACCTIAKAGHVRFKYIDAAGGTIEECDREGWREPKRRR